MKKLNWAFILTLSNLAVICGVVIAFLNLHYPIVGNDYRMTIPDMLDTLLHYKVNGFVIQWYTPTFGGGIPVYPDPNSGQFSLPMLLTLLIAPWLAVNLSTAIYIFVGGIFCFYLLKNVFKLHWTSSVLGATFFSANGFIVQRIAVGHLGYQIFPVLAILIFLLLDSSLPVFIAGILFALVVVALIYSAAYFLIIVFGLSISIVLPLVYIYKKDVFSWRRIAGVILIGGIISLLTSGSKLGAVYAFMKLFPRQVADNYPVSVLQGLLGIVLQLLGTMNLAPLLKLTGIDPTLMAGMMTGITGAPYGYWEFDMSISPIVWGILILGAYQLLRKPKEYAKWFLPDRKWIAWIFLAFFVWLTIEFILAKGLIYPYLQKLPILSSLHVNPRFTSALLFPLAFCAAILYNSWIANGSGRKSVFVFLIVNLFTLLPLISYFLIRGDLQSRNYDLTESTNIYNLIQAGDTLNITGISETASNTEALSQHLSNRYPYDPIFGYFDEYLHPEIKEGSIWEVSDGYYNMTNPTGYVFPEVNGSRPFERIKVSDKSYLEAFASHHQPTWKLPRSQKVLDWVSGLTFLISIAIVSLYGISRLRKRPRIK